MAAPAVKGKEVVKVVKLAIEAGKANPAPPVGPALGQAGVNIMEFCKQFNDRTKEKKGPVPVVINVFKDKSFEFITKISPMSYLIKQALGIESGSKKPGLEFIGKKITKDQIRKIAETKMPDLNTTDVEAAMRTVEGQCISMGIQVQE